LVPDPPAHPAEAEPLDQINPQGNGEKLKQREHEMRFNRKIQIGRLKEVSFANPSDLISHTPHIVDFTDMLDDGIRVDDIELSIAEHRHIPGVTKNTGHIWVRRRRWFRIKKDDFNVWLANEPDRFPDVLPTANVKYSQGPLQTRDGIDEALVAFAPEP